jgi:hypothetical protein
MCIVHSTSMMSVTIVVTMDNTVKLNPSLMQINISVLNYSKICNKSNIL